jgi:hypothetical protein
MIESLTFKRDPFVAFDPEKLLKITHHRQQIQPQLRQWTFTDLVWEFKEKWIH